MPHRISDPGLELIKGDEELRLKAYPDPYSQRGRAMQLPLAKRGAGWDKLPGGPWTIGWGHTGGVKEGDTCTVEQAREFLRLDAASAEGIVNQAVKVALTQNQFDALVSFVFNVGPGNPKTGREGFLTSTLLRKVNAGDSAGAAAEFQRWNHAQGTVSGGLTARRKREAALFMRAEGVA